PFVKDVNVDPANYTASWIDWYDWEHNNPDAGTCSNSTYNGNQSGCTSHGTCSTGATTTLNNCGTCSLSQYTNHHNNCNQNHGTWTAGTWTAATWTFDHSQWNGCVTDRGGTTSPGTTAGPDQDLSAPSAAAEPIPATARDSTKYPAEQYS